jgi:hypothetical protein
MYSLDNNLDCYTHFVNLVDLAAVAMRAGFVETDCRKA